MYEVVSPAKATEGSAEPGVQEVNLRCHRIPGSAFPQVTFVGMTEVSHFIGSDQCDAANYAMAPLPRTGRTDFKRRPAGSMDGFVPVEFVQQSVQHRREHHAGDHDED